MDMQNQNPMPAQKESSSKNALVVVGLIVVLAIVGLWIWKQSAEKKEIPQNIVGKNEAQVPSTDGGTATTSEDTTQAIEQDLQGINSIDLQNEFNAIDSNLNNL